MAESKDEPDTVRVIKLTDDEAKELQGAQPGQEVTCEVVGKLEADGHFHVMSVRAPGGGKGDMDDMSAQVAGSPVGGAPMVNMQTQPSPS